MRKLIFVLALFYCTAGLTAEGPLPRVVSVTGTGEVEALPDAAYINMAIEARHRKLETAQAEVDEKAAAFLKLVDQLKIARQFVQTTGKNVHPEYQWDEKTRRQHLIGYFVSRQLQVDLRELDKLGPLLHRSVELGVNQVSSPQMRATREPELRQMALARAAQNAGENASALANALGARLGKVRQISAQHDYQPQPVYRMAAMKMEAADMAAEQSYEAGQIKLTATVNATFDLE